MLRRLIKRTLLAPLLLLPLLSCGASLGKQRAGEVIRGSAAFTAPKFAHIPRVLSVHAGGGIPGSVGALPSRAGEMFGLDQMAGVDAAVAVLQARGRVQVEDFLNAVPSAAPVVYTPPPPPDSGAANDSTAPAAAAPVFTPPPSEWVHTLRITPRPQLDSALLSPDDGEDDGGGGADVPASAGMSVTSVGRTPGWKLAIGTREFGRVLAVYEANGDGVHVDPDEAVVDFTWHWRLTAAGDAFDGQGPEFQSLPESVQRAAGARGLRLDTSQPQWSRATLRKLGKDWTVKTVDWSYGQGRTIEAP
ncbi:MAG TPA: hypothetical protein VJU87_02495 [Gemmatimonadaceae bacterium]|nr:hypothetical protein [Gemmatimonadaceae bacterium]